MRKSYANKMVFLLNQKNIQNYSHSRNILYKAKLKYDERKNIFLSLPKLKSIHNSENEIIVEDNKNILLNKLNFSLEKDKENQKKIEKRNELKNIIFKSKSTKNMLTKDLTNEEYLPSLNNLSFNLFDFNSIKLKVRRLKKLKQKINPDNIYKTIDNKNLYFYHKNKKEDNDNEIKENIILKEETRNNMEKIRKGLIALNEMVKESSSLDSKKNQIKRKTTLKRIISFNSKL